MTHYTLSIDDAVALSTTLGVARSKRTIQRWCDRGWIESVRVDTEKNAKYLINRASLEKYLHDLSKADAITDASRDMSHDSDDTSRHVATPLATPDPLRRDMSRQSDEHGMHETSQPSANSSISEMERKLYEQIIEGKDKLIETLEKTVDDLQTDKNMLHEQMQKQAGLHGQQVELLLANARENTKSSNMFINFLHSIWFRNKAAPRDELPTAYGPIIPDMQDDEPRA